MPGIVLILRINCWAKQTWFPAYILEWEIPTGIDNNTMWQSLWWGRTVYCGSRYNPDLEVGGWFFREPVREIQKERPQPVMKSCGRGGSCRWVRAHNMFEGVERRRDWITQIIEISAGMDPRVHGVRKKGSSGNPLPSPVGLAESEDSCICMFVLSVFFLRLWIGYSNLGFDVYIFGFFFSSAAINLLFWSLARLPHFAPLPTHFVSGGLLILYSQWTDWD